MTEVKEAELVNFKPVCTEWQQEMCGRFNLTLKRKSRYSHLNPPSPISIDHEPQKTTRIVVTVTVSLGRSVILSLVIRKSTQVCGLLLSGTCVRTRRYSLVSYLIHRPWINISCRAKWKLHARRPQRWKYLPQQHF